MSNNSGRRDFICKGSIFTAAAYLSTFALPVLTKEEEVSPVEDFMREHGLLNRVLLIYDNFIERIKNKQLIDIQALADARDVIKNFIEDYHEKLEEEHLFPKFLKAEKLTDLVLVLRQQHEAGRILTAEIGIALKKTDLDTLGSYLSTFVNMYRPHEAREDTVLFPAFKTLVSENEYKELGEQFENLEHRLFGKEGFEGMVDKVADIEQKLGIYELSQFTPKRPQPSN